MMDPEADVTFKQLCGGIADFLYESGQLKRTERTGWALARMANRESVADHTFRTAIIAMVMAAMAGANPDLAAAIALLHDLPEARLGDMNHVTRRYLNEPKPFEQIIRDQTVNMPAPVTEMILERTRQWIDQSTVEASIARDADIIESIMHVRESLPERKALEDQWVRYLEDGIKTDVGREVLEEIIATDPDDWWQRAVKGD